MAAEQSPSLSVVSHRMLLSELPRVPPITITKNESQEYVISRGNNRPTFPQSMESVVSSATSSSYGDCNSYINQPCNSNYQAAASGSFVGPATSSDSFSSTSLPTNSNSRNHTSTQFHPAHNRIIFRSGNTMPNNNQSCQNDNYPSLYAPSSVSSDSNYSSLNPDLYRTPYNGNALNMSNYRSTNCPSSTSANVSNSTSYLSDVKADPSPYQIIQAARSWNKSVSLHPVQSTTTFNPNAQSNNHVSNDTAAGNSYGTSIQYVDLTYSSDLGNCHILTTNSTLSTPDGTSGNAVASSSTPCVNFIDSSQESLSAVEHMKNNSFTDSQLKIRHMLSEITFLMKSVRPSVNEYTDTESETQKREENDSTNYMKELQRFNAFSNMNTPPSFLLPKSKRLFSICKQQCQKYCAMLMGNQHPSLDDETMVYTMKLFLINLKRLFSISNAESSSSAIQYEGATSSGSSASRYLNAGFDISLDPYKGRTTSSTSTSKDSRVERYEKLIRYKDFKINYFKTMLDEKKDVEKKLEEAKKKCAELEEKLKKKDAVGCWREDNISEWCCELMSELKTTMLDLLENEFKCCICDELLIEPGVTNCQHVFCTFCLNTWREKKKECPVCRALVTNVYKVNAIDEYITAATSSVSDKAYAERLQVIEDRKNSNPPPAKKLSWSGPQSTLSPSSAPVTAVPRLPVPQFPPPYPLLERNPNWPLPTERMTWSSNNAHPPFPSSADIPTSGPWSQQIPHNTGGTRRPRPSTVYFSQTIADPMEGRSLDSYP